MLSSPGVNRPMRSLHGLITLSTLIVLASSGEARADESSMGAAKTSAPSAERRHAHFGLMLDAGVPDGGNVALVWRPFYWLRLHAGGSHNLASAGVRGGLSLVPFDAILSPSLVVEAGHFFDGNPREAIAGIVGEAPEEVPERASYRYANGHLGLEMGSPDFTFFVRGGYSYIEADIDAPRSLTSGQVRVRGAAQATALVPSAKLGFVFYLF